VIAEILSTGDEIRCGTIIDSNSAYIAQRLEEAGIEVARHCCVGDDINIIIAVLSEISSRANIAVVTGGLGPTADDLTAEAAAKAAGVELVFDKKAYGFLEEFFKKRSIPMSNSNRKQAFLPKGAEILHNPVGTASGFYLKFGKCLFFFLPGVPYEMRLMLSEAVLPQIEKLRHDSHKSIQVKSLSCFGIKESAAGEMLAGLNEKFPDIKLGLRAEFPEIQIKLYGSGRDEKSLCDHMKKAVQWVLEKLGEKVFSVDGSSMEAVVGRLLIKKRATVALAESCTGGLISDKLTNIPGSSEYFLFSGVTYSNESKIEVLGVSPDSLKRYGAVHEAVARQMAEGARRIAGATYGVATSGIAGPGGGTADKPVGTVCIGLAAPGYTKGFRFNFSFGRRSMNKNIFAMKALDLLRLDLLNALEHS